MTAILTKAKLRLKCIRRESDTHITATSLATIAAAPKQKMRAPTAKDSNNILGILPEISCLRFRFG